MQDTPPPIEAGLGNPHDAYFKNLFGRKATAREFFRLYLPPELVAELDLTTLGLDKDSFVSERLRAYFSDLVYRVQRKDGGGALIQLLLEHKSAPEHWTALQLLGYQSELWERVKESCGSKLPLIVPVVLYHGRRRWNAPRRFHALVAGAKALPWRRYVPDFEYYLCDLSRFTDAELAGSSGLRAGLLLMKHIFEQELAEPLKQIAAELKTLPSAQARQHLLPMAVYVGATKGEPAMREFEQGVSRHFPTLKGEIMETYSMTLIKQGVKEGRQQGLQEGRREEALALVLRQLKRRLDKLSARSEARIRRLSLEQLEQLGEDLLNFKQASDLTGWLRARQA